MSIQYCEYCDKEVDTDEFEHFDGNGMCIEQGSKEYQKRIRKEHNERTRKRA